MTRGTGTCGTGTGIKYGYRKSGSFSWRTPFKRTLKMHCARPDSCTVAADTQPGTGGSVHVWLIAWKN